MHDDDQGPVVTIFRSRLRDEARAAYGDMAVEVDRLARAMPGFVEAKGFTADDGERVTLVTFADRASHDAWRDDARHVVAQRAGRAEFYSEYRLQVCRCEEISSFTREADQR
jgi:heme-degrading monooxygenase HmoA